MTIAYHADARAEVGFWIAFVVAAVLAAGIAYLWVPPEAPARGRNVAARFAAGLVGLAVASWIVLRLLPAESVFFWLRAAGAVPAPFVALVGASRARRDGERALARVSLAAGLALFPGGLLAYFVSCAITQACFH